MTTLALLVLAVLAPPAMGQPAALTDTTIKMAVRDWDSNPTIASNKYGPIDGWNTAAPSATWLICSSPWPDSMPTFRDGMWQVCVT